MSAQEALPAPQARAIPLDHTHPRRFLVLRRLVFAAVISLLVVVTSVGVLLFCPPVLEGMSAMVLKPQPGAVPWNGRDRITVAVMGLTSRTPSDPPRTDTLLVMDIDPATRHVAMLSVPRDLWVSLPGYAPTKLASVYTLGGPKLTAFALEREYNIPVDYTISMTFWGFTKLIDAMGGVDVNVPQELNDPTYPCLVGYDYCPIDIKAGPQHMDGATSLEFVRERHALQQEDLARVKDQQAFSDAVKRTLISPKTWPRFPAILAALKQSLVTTVPYNALPEIGAQYVLARGSVQHSYINVENGMVNFDTSPDGQSILKPTSPTVIADLTHRLFTDDGLARESASVAVLNGSGTSGAASDVQSMLAGLGFQAISAGNADRADYTRCQVVVNTAVKGDAEYTARRLQRIFDATLVHEAVPGQPARIEVILGNDYPAV